MAFMVPVYEQGEFVRIEDKNGESCSIPLEYYNEADHAPECITERETGWFARLSAPGYMDCTEWSGPFATEDEAREYIRDTYEVDPDTGDDLPDED